MKITWIRIESLITTYKTAEGGEFKMISMHGNQCPRCFCILSIQRSKDNPNYAVIDECICDKNGEHHYEQKGQHE